MCDHKPKANDFSDPLMVVVFEGDEGEEPKILAVCNKCRELVFPDKGIEIGVS